MRESKVEEHLRQEIVKLGGICYKFTSPGRNHVVDRICVMPKSKVYWVELKAPGKKARPAQIREHNRLRDRGHEVFVIDSMIEVSILLVIIKGDLNEQ